MDQSIYIYVSTLLTNKIAFVDIDNTLTAHPWETKEKDLLDKELSNKAIQELQNNGFMCILATSRTLEMCMDERQYELSKKNHEFTRPQPHLGRDKMNKHCYIKPENIVPKRILNLPIIIASSGAQIALQQKSGGYIIDQSFYPVGFPNPSQWRRQTTSYLSALSIPFTYAAIDSEIMFYEGKTDIFPADYRIQVFFESQNNLLSLSYAIKNMKNLYFTNDSNPDKNIFTAYITPKRGKIDAYNHVLAQLSSSQSVLIIGDSLPDLQAGISVAPLSDIKVTVLLVGGSRLTDYIQDARKTDFAGFDLKPIKDNIKPTDTYGQYIYNEPKTKQERSVIIGDIAFPQSVGPKTIIEFVEKNGYNNATL